MRKRVGHRGPFWIKKKKGNKTQTCSSKIYDKRSPSNHRPITGHRGGGEGSWGVWRGVLIVGGGLSNQMWHFKTFENKFLDYHVCVMSAWKNQHEYTQNFWILRKTVLIWLQFKEADARNIYLAKVIAKEKNIQALTLNCHDKLVCHMQEPCH